MKRSTDRILTTGTDCGFASFAGSSAVDPAIVWAKLAGDGRGRGARDGRALVGRRYTF
jgi:hypothetical protein